MNTKSPYTAPPGYVGTSQFCRIVGRRSVQKWIDNGQLPAIKRGQRYYVNLKYASRFKEQSPCLS
jgi:hypothetical protein